LQGRYPPLALGGGIAVLVGYAAAGTADVTDDPAGFVSSVGLPLLALGVVAAAWANGADRCGPFAQRSTALTVSSGRLRNSPGTTHSS
jgi:hypothetical protein